MEVFGSLSYYHRVKQHNNFDEGVVEENDIDQATVNEAFPLYATRPRIRRSPLKISLRPLCCGSADG